MPIGDRLREERERLGFSQPKLASIAGTTKQTLYAWETGRTAPDAVQLSAIATAGADVQYIVTGNRPKALPAPALNKSLLRQIVEGVEETLSKSRKNVTPDKKAELIFVLYEHFAPKGKIIEEEFRSYLKLVA